MVIGVLIAVAVGLAVFVTLGKTQGFIAGVAIFAIWFAIRQARARQRRRRLDGDGAHSGSPDGLPSHETSGSSSTVGEAPSVSGGGGIFGGAGASGFWGFIFDSNGFVGGGDHGGFGGNGHGGNGGNGGNGGH